MKKNILSSAFGSPGPRPLRCGSAKKVVTSLHVMAGIVLYEAAEWRSAIIW